MTSGVAFMAVRKPSGSVDNSTSTRASGGIASGLKACEQAFIDLKQKRKYKFIVISVENGEFVLEATGKKRYAGAGAAEKALLKALPHSGCRFAVHDYEYKTSDGRISDKLFFISWCPRPSTARQKMEYTTEKPKFRSLCHGVFDVNAVTTDDVLVGLGVKKQTAHSDSEDEDDEEWDPDA